MALTFFDKIVDIVDSSIDSIDAYELVLHHCKLIGKKSDELKPEHGGLFIMKLMSSLSERLPNKQWSALDRRFKNLISENESPKGKVKGIILSGTLDYVALKQGKLALNEIVKRIKLPTYFREDSWYPIAILEVFLDGVDLVMLQKGGLRTRSVGRHVLSQKILKNSDHWFGSGQNSTFDAFCNIGEILSLDDFSLNMEEGMLLMSFHGDVNRQFREFLMGICDAIFKMRNIFPSSVESVDSGNGTTIVLRYDVTGMEAVS
jgi:hypothetical protein